MGLGVGALKDGNAKQCIRDKHNVFMATSKQRLPPALSHWPNRSMEIKHSTEGERGRAENQQRVI